MLQVVPGCLEAPFWARLSMEVMEVAMVAMVVVMVEEIGVAETEVVTVVAMVVAIGDVLHSA